MPVLPLINFSGGEVSPFIYPRLDLEAYFSSCKYMENFIPTQYGAAKRRSGFRLVNETKYPDRNTRLIPFVFNTEQAYVLEFGDRYMRIHYNGQTIINPDGSIYEISTPYPHTALEGIQYTQSADYLFLVHEDYPPYELTRTGQTSWDLNAINFGPPTRQLVAPTVSFQILDDDEENPVERNREYTYAYTYVDSTGAESEISYPTTEIGTYSLTYQRYMLITIATPGGNPGVVFDYYNVYRNVNGFWAYIGRAKQNTAGTYTFEDNGTYIPDASRNPPTYETRFNTAGNYPRTVTFDQNRLVFGGTKNNPNEIWGSQINNYRNFATYQTPTAISPYNYSLVTDQVNAIQWMRSAARLLIGTTGSEWRLADVRADQPYDGRRSTSIGSAYIQALGANENTLFVNRISTAVHAFSYSYQINDYKSDNLCILAEHLFRKRSIKEWAYSSSPFGIVWCVCDDGIMLGMVYNPNQNVTAWARFTTQGSFKSVACIPAAKEDATYIISQRQIGNVTKQYVEILEEEFHGEIENAFFVDCGITYDLSTPTREVTGLEYLEGAKVSILADGACVPDKIVQDGKISLNNPASIIHIGLSYVSEMETLELEGGAQDRGISQSRVRFPNKVSIRFDESVGGLVGTDRNNLTNLILRDSTVPLSRPRDAISGFREVSPEGGWNEQPTIIVKQIQPLPITISGIFTRVGLHGG